MIVTVDGIEWVLTMVLVEYMCEKQDGLKMAHGSILLTRGLFLLFLLKIRACSACKMRETQREKFQICPSKTSFVYRRTRYKINDLVYVRP